MGIPTGTKTFVTHPIIWSKSENGAYHAGDLRVIEVCEGERHMWMTLLDGKRICRSYGYKTAKDAMFAAPHLKPVQEQIKNHA
jgi:hypothetical protein